MKLSQEIKDKKYYEKIINTDYEAKRKEFARKEEVKSRIGRIQKDIVAIKNLDPKTYDKLFNFEDYLTTCINNIYGIYKDTYPEANQLHIHIDGNEIIISNNSMKFPIQLQYIIKE